MPKVDLVYSPDCPNVSLGRSNLLIAFARAGVKPQWSEHRMGDPNAPDYTRGFGSPSILVGGLDVAGESASSEATCRVYAGATRAPAVDQIANALAGRQSGEYDESRARMFELATQSQEKDTKLARAHLEVFDAGSTFEATIELIGSLACSSCEITVHDVHDAAVAARARSLGIQSMPAIIVDGELP